MLLTTVVSALALCGSASAFSDTSPFVLLSTKSFAESPSQDQLQTSSQVDSIAKDFLKSCPTDRYLVVSQPNIHAKDLQASGAAPSLRTAVGLKLAASWSVSDVHGEISMSELSEHIKDACSKVDKDAQVEEMKLAPLPPRSPDRASILADNDHLLGESLRSLQSSDSYTMIYLSSPAEAIYEPEFQGPLHAELKRSNGEPPIAPRKDNRTEFDKLPLFEKYHFFGPGLFMTLTASIILITVLFLGLRSLSSLSVSYGAFDKEMGPAQQKKQQ